MQKVLIENALFFAYHGLHEEEQLIGGKFLVYLTVETDFSLAAEEDNIEGTVNYVALYELVKEEMQLPSKLIEHVAHRILKRMKAEFSGIHKVNLKISKLNPPISGEVESVSVEVEEEI